MIDVLLFGVFLALGLHLQRRPDGDRIREVLWNANFVVVIPLAVAYSFLTIHLDRDLLATVPCVVGAWWLLLGLGWLWGTAVGRDRPERATLALAAAFPNTGFVGFPLAHLAYGAAGLRSAVVYDTVSMVVPAVVVCTAIARASVAPVAGLAAGPGVLDEAAAVGGGTGWRRVVRETLLAAPLLALVATLAVRTTLTGRVDHQLAWLGTVIGHVVGPVGFLLLGLALPLGFEPGRRGDTPRLAGSLALRLLAGPLLLLGVARVAGVHVQPAFVLVAGMPVAFHVLVISRLTGLRHELAARAVLASTVIAVATVVTWVALR